VTFSETNPGRHEARVYCPMGDVEIRRCTDYRAKTDSNSKACPRLEQCSAERRALSNKFNPPMTNEFICRTWPGAHVGVISGEETQRWVLRPHRARGCCEPVKGVQR
jgi:hypothetical protein